MTRSDVEDAADELHTTFGLPRVRLWHLVNLAYRPSDVGFDGTSQLHRRWSLKIDLEQAGENGVDQDLDARALPYAMQLGIERRLHRTTAFVPEYHEERRAQVSARILKAAAALGREDVAGDTHDEQGAEAGVEDQLRRNARVATAKDRSKGLLTAGEMDEDVLLRRRKAGLTLAEARIARNQALERLVR